MTSALLALFLAANVDVTADGCVDVDVAVAALAEGAALDPAERVQLEVMRSADSDEEPYRLKVMALLLNAPPFERQAALRASECDDVVDLVVVWLAAHRRAARAGSPSPSSPPFSSPASVDDVALRPARTRSAPVSDRPLVTESSWSACDGPPPCLGLNVAAGVGVSADGSRLFVDGGWGLVPDVDVVLLAEVSALGASEWNTIPVDAGASVGVAWRTPVPLALVTVRGLLGAGVMTIGDLQASTQTPTCTSQSNLTISGDQVAHVSPLVAVRAELGWAFAEVGGLWRFGVFDHPTVYAAVGVVLSRS
jgi:hypothetical protein